MVFSLDNAAPNTSDAIYIAHNATIVGNVILGSLTSIWFSAVLRGDMDTITIGEGTNIQDNAVLHVDSGFPLSIGSYVTVGHGAILHGCTIGDGVLAGMGSTILNGAVIGDGCVVGAGALIPPGKRFEPRSLLVGAPAKAVRTVTDEDLAEIRKNAERYIENARRYAANLAEV